jgi:cellulose synthase/poly-beta-1,6-N-acetylglucosamine synthase-like glycosyltransferase
MLGMLFPLDVSLIIIILILLQVILPIVSILTSLYFVFIFLSRPKRIQHGMPPGDPLKHILVLIPARNEQNVIPRVLDSLRQADYPAELLDVHVIADNCSDHTAAVARAAGFSVLERHDLTAQSKAHALHWAFYDCGLLDAGYDAITIIDADSVINPDFFRHVDGKLRQGAKVVQGSRRPLNPGDSVFSALMSITYAFENRLWYVPHANHGLSTMIVGSGVTISCDHLRLIGWDIRTLVEDAEFTIQSVLAGERVHYCDEAIVKAELPSTFRMLWRQLRRWFSGHIACGRFYLPAIWRKVRLEHGGQASILLVNLIIPFTCTIGLLQILLGLATTYQLLGGRTTLPAMLSGLALNQLAGMAAAMIILIMDGCLKNHCLRDYWKGVLFFPYLGIFLGIIYLVSYIHPKKAWVPVEHQLSVNETAHSSTEDRP